MKRNLLALILATGEAKKCRTSESRPLLLLGKSPLQLAAEAAAGVKPLRIFVCGDELEVDPGRLPLPGVLFLAAPKEQGIHGFLLAARDILAKKQASDVLVLDGRVPLLTSRSLRSLLARHQKENNALTALRPSGDAFTFISRAKDLLAALGRAKAQRKRSMSSSDLIQTMAGQGKKVGSYRLRRPEECLIVDSPAKLSAALSFLRERKLAALEKKGVIVLDPVSTWIDLDVRIGRDTVIYPSVVIEGRSRIGRGCRIYPFVYLVHTRTGDRVKILSSTMIERSTIGHGAQVGPFTHFRPQTVIRPGAKVGNFVEMKNTVFGEGSKAGHLSYLGDAVVGQKVNVGAGTITCNYDGFKKSRTV
ncbi:MAG: NTP transferase domain-containing protein, partial [Acidobacteriota bacterium]